MGMSSETQVWRSRIVPSSRGAIFRAKRWFYGTIYASIKEQDAKERSKENWARLARALVEKSNSEGVSDKAARITIYYRMVDGVFTPVKAELEAYELRPIKTIEVSDEELS